MMTMMIGGVAEGGGGCVMQWRVTDRPQIFFVKVWRLFFVCVCAEEEKEERKKKGGGKIEKEKEEEDEGELLFVTLSSSFFRHVRNFLRRVRHFVRLLVLSLLFDAVL